MLGSSEFDFIVRYFFYVLLSLVGIGLVNGLLFFPVLLSLVGPAAELIPNEHPDRISTPSPEPSPVRTRKSRHPVPPRRSASRSAKTCNSRIHAEPSLTTITEEPQSWQSSQSIVVQPEVVVETTYNTNDSSSSGRSSPGTQTQAITKVTATANIKVEVHTPLVHSRRHHYRDGRDSGHESDGSRHS